ncbi:MAG: glutathione S-transferase N-terminal domain-containing protein, partial [Pseudomonadota bacterium]
MKLFDSFGMNPRTIRFYLLEKGIDIPRQEVDILGAENRQADYLQLNPAGQTPALELDDGRVISETYAICEYLEEKYPAPSLIGTTPEERAETRMWWR